MTQQLPSWHDRKTIKEAMVHWFSSKKFAFLLTLTDIQEIEDIVQWLDAENKTHLIAHIYFDTDTVASKYNLLEQIRDEYGKNNFLKFNNYDSLIAGMGLPNINQSIGDESTAKGDQEYQRNTQIIKLENIDPVALIHNNKERMVNSALDKLLDDLRSFLKKKPLLLVIRFQTGGFDKLSKDFKSWFRLKFLKDLTKLSPQIRVCMICQNTHSDLTSSVEEAHKHKVDQLHVDEIIIFANQFIKQAEMFCRGMVEPDNQRVEYRTFKSKLFAEIQRQQSGNDVS